MAPISSVVDVTITKSTLSVQQAAFNVALILGSNLKSSSRVNYFSQTALDDLASHLVGGTDAPEYIAAAAYFAQQPCPAQVAIGLRMPTKVFTFTLTPVGSTQPDITAGSIKATVNGTVVSQSIETAEGSTAFGHTLNLLATLINTQLGESLASVSSASAQHTYTLTVIPGSTVSTIDLDLSELTWSPAPADQPVSLPAGMWTSFTMPNYTGISAVDLFASVVSNIMMAKDAEGNVYMPVGGVNNIGTMIPNMAYLVFANTACTLNLPGAITPVYSLVQGVETVATALDACQLENSGWYGLVLAGTPSNQEIISAAQWCQSNGMKICAVSTDDPNAVGLSFSADSTSTTPTLAQSLALSGLTKTVVIYSSDSAHCPEAALLGNLLWRNPGSYTAKFKMLSGIKVDSLTDTERKNANDKHMNTYEYTAGVYMFSEGVVATGEYIDVMIFIDWLTARIGESVFGALAGPAKVPYDETGLLIVENAVRGPLGEGQRAGGISPTLFNPQDKSQIGGFYMIMPDFVSISSTDKGNRVLNNVQFMAYLAGAIHHVSINGNVTY